jgi:hypothetical protein
MFNLHCIPDGSTVFVVSSDTDQTTRLIQEILRVKAYIPHTVMFSKDRLYSDILVKQEILDRQSKLFSERHTSPDRDSRMIAVFDNCFPNETWKVDLCMAPFFTMGRSYAITSLFGVLSIGRLPPSRRHGIDLLFVGPSLQKLERQQLFDRFVYHCSFETFSNRLDTEGWLVIRLDVAEPVMHAIDFV